MKFIFILFFSLNFFGCATTSTGKFDPESYDKLELGQTTETVKSIVGSPPSVQTGNAKLMESVILSNAFTPVPLDRSKQFIAWSYSNYQSRYVYPIGTTTKMFKGLLIFTDNTLVKSYFHEEKVN